MLVKTNAVNFQWVIYDTINKSYFDRKLPLLTQKTNFQWLDNHSFIYSEGLEIKLGKVFTDANLDSILFELTEDEKADVTTLSAEMSSENTQIIIRTKNKDERDLYWVKTLSPDIKEAQLIIKNFNADFEYLASSRSKLYFLTNLSASRNRIISIDLNSPERRNWKEVIAQNSNLLIDAIKINNQWLLLYQENSRSKLYLASLNGQDLKSFDTASGSNYELLNIDHKILLEQNNSLLSIKSNLLNASQIIKLNLVEQNHDEVTNNSPQLKSLNNELNSQVHFFRSKDGSRVPLTLYAQHKIKRDSPTLILANDGDGSLFENKYVPIISAFIQAGGLVAVIHTRGGATYGNNWYHSATGKNRIKIVEDLIAGQNWLFDKNYTSPNKLAIYASKKNASSFALFLTKSEANPKAAIFNDGIFDLFNKAKKINQESEQAIDKNWIQQFNYSPTEKSTATLEQLNPLTNINIKPYPAVLMVTSESNRGSLKYLAKLQNYQNSDQAIMWLNSQDTEKYYKALYFLEQQLKL